MECPLHRESNGHTLSHPHRATHTVSSPTFPPQTSHLPVGKEGGREGGREGEVCI